MFIRMFGHVMFAKLIVLRGGSKVFVFYPGNRIAILEVRR